MGSKSVVFLVLLLVVLASQGMIEVPQVEARVCESKSQHYKGHCFKSHNCAMVCKTEGGFTGGVCRGFRRHCFCTRKC